MKTEEFNKLSKEGQQEEIERCQSFEYFYNNYYKRDGMPNFSQKVWDEYVETVNKQRFNRIKLGNNSCFYPFTTEEAFKTNK